MKLNMKKAQKMLQDAMETKGVDNCHICGKEYGDYEHTFEGVTKKGEVLSVCGPCSEKLEDAIGFGVRLPLNPNEELWKLAYYNHPWNIPGNVKGTH